MALIVVFRNDLTGPDHAANYEVQVFINQQLIETTRVEGHQRAEGWRALVRRLVIPAASKPIGVDFQFDSFYAGMLAGLEERLPYDEFVAAMEAMAVMAMNAATARKRTISEGGS